MFQNGFIIVMILFCLKSYAQEPLMPIVSDQDTLPSEIERSIMYQQLLTGVPPLEDWLSPAGSINFDFNNNLKYFKYQGNPSTFREREGAADFIFRPGSGHPGSLFWNETLFSGSSINLNNRFSFGGYSFGANAPWKNSLPNRELNQFDYRGSTLFMEYHISKNFRIGTQMQIIQGPGF
jgi:hypothetical protein